MLRRTREYTVILHEAEEGGYWIEIPSLSGCFSQGETVEEALHNAAKAIKSHIEALTEDGQPVPKDRAFLLGKVKVAV